MTNDRRIGFISKQLKKAIDFTKHKERYLLVLFPKPKEKSKQKENKAERNLRDDMKESSTSKEDKNETESSPYHVLPSISVSQSSSKNVMCISPYYLIKPS